MVTRRRVRELADQQLQSFGVELDLDQRMSTLRIGDRQVVELCRVFGRRSAYVLLASRRLRWIEPSRTACTRLCAASRNNGWASCSCHIASTRSASSVTAST